MVFTTFNLAKIKEEVKRSKFHCHLNITSPDNNAFMFKKALAHTNYKSVTPLPNPTLFLKCSANFLVLQGCFLKQDLLPHIISLNFTPG